MWYNKIKNYAKLYIVVEIPYLKYDYNISSYPCDKMHILIK